jgi:phosphatidylglycerophosphate synthase
MTHIKRPAIYTREKLASDGDGRFMDIGERIAFPLIPYIPYCITPNMLSTINHLVNLALFGVVIAGNCGEDGWFLVAAALTSCTVVLDCMDGMLARGRGLCSPIGAIIDHGNDGMHVPLNSGIICAALSAPTWILVLALLPISCLYHIQLLSDLHFGFFGQVSGPAAQFTTVALYIVRAYAPDVTKAYPSLFWAAACVLIVTYVVQCRQFVWRFRWSHWLEFGGFLALNLLLTIPLATGSLEQLPWMWVSSLLSYRMAVLLVLEKTLECEGKARPALLRRPVAIWVFLFIAISIFCSAGSPVPDMAVIVFTLQVYSSNFLSVWRNFPRLQRLRKKLFV